MNQWKFGANNSVKLTDLDYLIATKLDETEIEPDNIEAGFITVNYRNGYIPSGIVRLQNGNGIIVPKNIVSLKVNDLTFTNNIAPLDIMINMDFQPLMLSAGNDSWEYTGYYNVTNDNNEKRFAITYNELKISDVPINDTYLFFLPYGVTPSLKELNVNVVNNKIMVVNHDQIQVQ